MAGGDFRGEPKQTDMKRLLFPLLLPLLLSTCVRAQTTDVPLRADAWDLAGMEVAFETHQGQPAMKLNDKGADATGSNLVKVKDLVFRNGTIEYDIALQEGARFSSCYFRMQDPDNSEHVYLRAAFIGDPNNSSGFQYAGVVDGVNYWDLSFPYQTGVEMKPVGEFNRIKIVVRDRQLLAYVNDMDRPALYIPIMDGEVDAGSIGFDGKAWIANVSITPDATPGLHAGVGFDPVHNDVRYLRNWQVSQPVDLPPGREIVAADLPDQHVTWSRVVAEHHGLVNLSRKFGQTPRGSRRMVWLRTTLTAAEAMQRQLRLGISDEVTIFLNGRYLYTGKNPYATPGMMAPRGRASTENTEVSLALKAGENELLIGVANNFFGWGVIAQLNDSGGIKY